MMTQLERRVRAIEDVAGPRYREAGEREAVRSLGDAPPPDWPAWLAHFFPTYTTSAPAAHHAELWAWAWAIALGERPRPFVAILPRGGAKSTSAELACAAWFARKQRRYIWYVSETQDQADDHVGTVASMLESEAIARAHPRLGERMTGKFGNSRGWRRDRIRTSDGSTVDALGLDVAARGIKLEEMRLDAIIFDDLDRQTDGPEIVDKKLCTLTRSILPSGASDLAVLAIQNLIHDDGIFARLAGVSEHATDMLADRIVTGPHPALLDAAYDEVDGRWTIAAGTPTWAGQDLDARRRMVDTHGLSAFRVECQHEVDRFEGGMFSHVAFRHCAPDATPHFVRTAVWVDPAVTSTDRSDSHAIQADGLGPDGTLYRLYSWEGITSPRDALTRAILVALKVGALEIGVETDQGGDTWESVYDEAWRRAIEDGLVAPNAAQPWFRQDKAGAGHGPKAHRAAQMLTDYEHGTIVHVLGTHATLERGLRRFPLRKPFDLVDAAYWSWRDLRDMGSGMAENVGVTGRWRPG